MKTFIYFIKAYLYGTEYTGSIDTDGFALRPVVEDVGGAGAGVAPGRVHPGVGAGVLTRGSTGVLNRVKYNRSTVH